MRFRPDDAGRRATPVTPLRPGGNTPPIPFRASRPVIFWDETETSYARPVKVVAFACETWPADTLLPLTAKGPPDGAGGPVGATCVPKTNGSRKLGPRLPANSSLITAKEFPPQGRRPTFCGTPCH